MKSLLDKVNAKLNAQGGFLKAISVLVGGTTFAQILGIITLPIITRLYNPSEFGLFAMYTSILAVIMVIGCLRYEIAIPIPRDNNTALSLVKVSLLSLFSMTIILFLIIIIIHYLGFNNFFKGWLWVIPISIFLTCIFNIFQYWYIRQKEFKYIAITKIQQSSIVSFAQIIGGLMHVSGGLILGSLLGLILGFVRYIHKFIKEKNSVLNRTFKKEALEYKNFPLFSTFEALFNTGGVYLPLIIIGVFLNKEDLALVFLTIKVLALPISLIGSAIAQVYLSHAGEYSRRAELRSFTNNILKKLVVLMTIPFLLILVLAPKYSTFIFGNSWEGVGQLILIMLPWFYLQLLSSPVSSSLHVTNNQKIALLLQIFGFVLRVGGVYFLCVFDKKAIVIEYYAYSGAIFYLVYFCVIQYLIAYSDKSVVKSNG